MKAAGFCTLFLAILTFFWYFCMKYSREPTRCIDFCTKEGGHNLNFPIVKKFYLCYTKADPFCLSFVADFTKNRKDFFVETRNCGEKGENIARERGFI